MSFSPLLSLSLLPLFFLHNSQPDLVNFGMMVLCLFFLGGGEASLRQTHLCREKTGIIFKKIALKNLTETKGGSLKNINLDADQLIAAILQALFLYGLMNCHAHHEKITLSPADLLSRPSQVVICNHYHGRYRLNQSETRG